MANKEENDYNPFEHRTPVTRPNTDFEAVVHILKGTLGTGILALPLAFSYTGWLVGFISTFVITASIAYSMNLLVKSMYVLCKEQQIPNLTYPQSMEKGLNRGPDWMKPLAHSSTYLVDGFLILLQFGTCVVYVTFLAENIKQIFDEYLIKWDVRIWMVILFVPLLALAMIPDLKRLAPLSLVGNILAVVSTIMLLYYILQDLPSIEDRGITVSISKYPLFLGMSLFSLDSVAIIIIVEQNMKTPQHFRGLCGVLSISFVIIAVFYAAFGLFGFWKYGKDSKASVTLNIPQDEWLANSIRIAYIIVILISHPLNAYVPVDIIWNQHFKSKVEEPSKQLGYEYLVRFLNILVTTLLAIAIPNLGLFTDLTGAFCLSVLAIIFPPILDICVHWPDKLGRFKWILIKDILLFIFGIFGLSCGFYVCIRDIVLTYS